MEGLVKAVGKATAPWWSSTSYEDELDATDAAWVRNGKSDSLDSSEACSPRRRSFGDGPRPIPPLDEDPRGRKPSYEEEVKDASPKKTHDQWTCPQCTFLNVEDHGKCGVCGSARPLPPPPPVNPLTAGKAKLGRGSGISLSPDAKRLAALLSVDADTVVVVKPGYEPPTPVKEGLDDAEDDATTVTDPRPKSSPSVDGANEQEAYGVAVSLLVAGLRPDDLEERLQSEGWSPSISAKVSRDLGKLGAGLSRHEPAPPSKPSPDALNAMLAKRAPQIKKPDQPDPLAAYIKMKKFGVAAEGVLARMQMDGCSEQLKARFRKLHKLEPSSSTEVTAPVSPEAVSPRATIALHWEKMENQTKKSVWNGGDTFAEHGELDAEDLTDLKDIFSAKASTAPVRRKSPPSIMRASPLDAKRAQNATIALAIASRKFRGDFDRVWRAVAECAAALPIDALERLQEVLPTKKETESVIQWFHAERAARPNVPAYSLGSPAERFILATSRVPRHQEYLAAAKLRASFQERYDKIDEGSRVAIDAAQSLVQSRGLTLVLQRILAVGNAMNAGTSIGDARGIRLGSLLAIVETRVEIKFRAPHAIDASPNSLLAFHTGQDQGPRPPDVGARLCGAGTAKTRPRPRADGSCGVAEDEGRQRLKGAHRGLPERGPTAQGRSGHGPEVES